MPRKTLNPTEENRRLADEYLAVIGKYYDEYLTFFSNNVETGADIVGETLLKTHRAICNKGFKGIEGVTKEEKEQKFKDYFFIAAKLNCLTEKKNLSKNKSMFEGCAALDNVTVSDEDTKRKVSGDYFNDYKIIFLLNTVELNFDVIDYRCFRLYHMLNLTYAKLREMTGIRNCKERVVRVNKWLRENITEEEIMDCFRDEYPDLAL